MVDVGHELKGSRQRLAQACARALVLLLCGAGSLGAGGCATVRSAYVPMPLASGPAPGRGRAELAVRTTGMPGVERASAPAAESLYVPNLAVDFAVAVRAARYFAFRL